MIFFYILLPNLTLAIMAKKTSSAAKKSAKGNVSTKAASPKVVAKKTAVATKKAAKKAPVKPAKSKPAAQKPVAKKVAPIQKNKVKPVAVKKTVAKSPAVKKESPKKKDNKTSAPKEAVSKPVTAAKAAPANVKSTANNRPKKVKQVFIPFNPLQPSTAVKTIKKEPKGKFELEYVIRCSEPLLYEFVSTPSGLSEWFSDDVNIRDGIYTFVWEGSEQKAHLVAFKEEYFIRFQWVDKNDGSYFEFRIQTDELTGDVSLMWILLTMKMISKVQNCCGMHR